MKTNYIKQASDLFAAACAPHTVSKFDLTETDTQTVVTAEIELRGKDVGFINIGLYKQFAAVLIHASGFNSMSKEQFCENGRHVVRFTLPSKCPKVASCPHALNVSEEIKLLKEEELSSVEATRMKVQVRQDAQQETAEANKIPFSCP